MKRPERWEVVFSLKTFLAGMLALYIALAADMQRPYWALTTVYVVSQPFAAASQSKGVFRFGGTVVGASVAIALGAIFGADDLAMLLGVTTWFCLCGYFALLDRSPRSYFFLLAGMTAVLVGWPGGAATLFDTATARVEEIGLGILCAVLVHSIVFPRAIEPTIRASMAAWAGDARRLVIDVLTGRNAVAEADRRKVAADAGRVGLLTVHLRYDTPEHKEAARWIDVLQQRMLMLLPVSASIESRLAAVRQSGGSTADIDTVLERIAAWIDGDAPQEQAAELKGAIDAIEPTPDASTSWVTIQRIGLIERLRDLVSVAGDCRDLRAHIASGSQKPGRRLLALARRTAIAPHRDRGMAIWSIASALLAGGAASLVWYFTGWPLGSGMAQIALMMCLFLGQADDLRPMLRSMLWVLCLAIVMDSFYMYVVMPRIQDFWMVALALAPALLFLGILGTNPATLLVGLMPVAMLTVSPTASTDVATFVNGMVATQVGVGIGLVVTGIVRSIGVETSARRILRAGWRDLEAIATASGALNGPVFASRMLDRLGLLAPRLAALPAGSEVLSADAMADLRLGLDLIELQRLRRHAGEPMADHIGRLLDSLGAYFHGRRRRGVEPPSADVLIQLDRCMAEASRLPGLRGHREALLLSLSGIRQSLFPEAPAYEPPVLSAELEDVVPSQLAAE